MMEVRKNAWLLDRIRALKQKTNISFDPYDLEFDDFLNPQMTQQAYAMGLDMKFMVEFVGGEKTSLSSKSNSFDEYDFDGSNSSKMTLAQTSHKKPKISL